MDEKKIIEVAWHIKISYANAVGLAEEGKNEPIWLE